MNTRRRVSDAKLLDDALRAFRGTSGFEAKVARRTPPLHAGRQPDAPIEIRANGRPFRFFAKIKAVDRAAALAVAKHQLEPFGRQGILVAPYLTPDLASYCRERLDLYFMDAAGNAYLRAPGLLVFIRGQPVPADRPLARGGGGGTAAALRVVFALLCKPDLVNAPYREIAAAAGVALGTIGRVILDLERRGHITAGRRKRNRHLLEAARLLDEWVTSFPIRLRAKLNPRRFRAPHPGWWQEARLEARMRWSGEVAAARLTKHLRPATYTIYVDPQHASEAVAALVKAYRLRADVNGNVEVLEAFWNFEAPGVPPDLVPPALVYADLVATLDPRNLEVAKQIRAEFLDNALRRG